MQIECIMFTLHNEPDVTDIIEVPDGSTDAEIQAAYNSWLQEHVSLTWEKLDD